MCCGADATSEVPQKPCNSDPSKRSIVVMITDQCPECEANHMDIQALTWAKVRTAPSRLPSGVALPYTRRGLF